MLSNGELCPSCPGVHVFYVPESRLSSSFQTEEERNRYIRESMAKAREATAARLRRARDRKEQANESQR